MNYTKKYLKYKSKYDSLKKNIIEQKGGLELEFKFNLSDDIRIINSENRYHNHYGTISSRWMCCDENNLSQHCTSQNITVFNVYEILVPTAKIITTSPRINDQYTRITVNIKESDLEVPIWGHYIQPKSYVTVKSGDVLGSIIKTFDSCKPFFNTKTEQNELGAYVKSRTNPVSEEIVCGEDLVLSTSNIYVGQHVKINSFKTTDPERKTKYKDKNGHHGTISEIKYSKLKKPKVFKEKISYDVTIDNCIIKVNEIDSLLIQWTKPTMYDYPVYVC